MLIGFFELIS